MHLLSSKGECVALHTIRLTVNKFNITNYMHYELESFTILKEQLTYLTSDSLRNKGKKKRQKTILYKYMENVKALQIL